MTNQMAHDDGGSSVITERTEQRYATEIQAPTRTPRGWRWEVTKYRLTDPVYPGVYDGRKHIATVRGYKGTRWGAWRAIRRAAA